VEPVGPARVERRLAAILAADIAGYSRLIEADEEGTLGRLKALRASQRRRLMRGDLPCFDDRCWRRETSTGLAVTLSHLERM
jgi:hypothetical protein